MKTVEQVKQWFKKRPVPAGKVINKHRIIVEEMEEDFKWSKVTIPVWPNNTVVIHGVIKLLAEVIEWEPGVWISINEDYIELHIYES